MTTLDEFQDQAKRQPLQAWRALCHAPQDGAAPSAWEHLTVGPGNLLLRAARSAHRREKQGGWIRWLGAAQRILHFQNQHFLQPIEDLLPYPGPAAQRGDLLRAWLLTFGTRAGVYPEQEEAGYQAAAEAFHSAWPQVQLTNTIRPNHRVTY